MSHVNGYAVPGYVPPPPKPKKTKWFNHRSYSHLDYGRQLEVNEDGTVVYNEDVYRLSLEVRKVEALESIAARLKKLHSDMVTVNESLLRLILATEPESLASRTDKKKAADKIRLREESKRRAEAVYAKAAAGAVGGEPLTGFSTRTGNAFDRMGLKTFGDLIAKTADELLEARSFGTTCLAEVRKVLADRGLRLTGDGDDTAEYAAPAAG